MMTMTAVIAVCCIALAHESPWTRASLSTIALGLMMNALVRCAICRGERQAFAIGFSISSFFYLLSLYTLVGLETLPLLITQQLRLYLVAYSTNPVSEDHFYIAMVFCWGLLCAYTGGVFALQWYKQRINLAEVGVQTDALPSID